MKIKNFLSTLLLCGIISVGFVACSDDDDKDEAKPTPPANTGPSLMKKISETEGLDSFVVAANKIGLNTTLTSTNNITVFAPNNQTFIDLLTSMNANSIEVLPNQVLEDILIYHISNSGKFKSADILGTQYISSIDDSGPEATNLSIQIINNGGSISINGSATVTKKDIVGGNGVAHVIDKMLKKPTLVDFIKSDARFDSIRIVLANTNFKYIPDVYKSGKRTLFLPTNEACATYISNNPAISKMSKIDLFTIPSFVGYHSVNAKNTLKSQMTEGLSLRTEQGGSLTVDLSNGLGLKTANSAQGTVKIIDTDIQSTSGVLHLVDEVLLYN